MSHLCWEHPIYVPSPISTNHQFSASAEKKRHEINVRKHDCLPDKFVLQVFNADYGPAQKAWTQVGQPLNDVRHPLAQIFWKYSNIFYICLAFERGNLCQPELGQVSYQLSRNIVCFRWSEEMYVRHTRSQRSRHHEAYACRSTGQLKFFSSL